MKKNRRNKKWAAVLAVVAVILLAGYWWKQPPLVSVTSLQHQPLTHTVVASGRIETHERTHIASQVLGTVAQVHVDEQQRVERAQALLTLDQTEAQAALAQAQAALQVATTRLARLHAVTAHLARESVTQAQTQLSQAQRQLAYWQRLKQEGNASQDQYDQARETLALRESQHRAAQLQLEALTGAGYEIVQAQSERDQAEAAVAVARARLAHTVVTAPAEGLILARLVAPGQVVQPGASLFFFAPSQAPQVRVPVDEKNLGLVQPGQRARVVADAYPGQSFEAVVQTLAPAIDANRGAVDVELSISSVPEYLREDMTVSVEIIVAEKKSAALLPSAAIQDLDSARPWVWRLDQSRVYRQPLQIGARDNGNIEVLKGLAADAQVAMPGVKQTLSEGLLVRGGQRLP